MKGGAIQFSMERAPIGETRCRLISESFIEPRVQEIGFTTLVLFVDHWKKKFLCYRLLLDLIQRV